MRAIIHEGDCLAVLPTLPSVSVDLIMTSPPYAKRRERTYGGIDADAYVDWFLPIAAQLHRVLNPSGSFVLNIKEHCENGERHTYVLDLIHALRAQGWLWTEEYIWHKPSPVPGKWPNRLKDGWERCLHFTKSRTFTMYQGAVKVPSVETDLQRQRRDKRRGGRYLSPSGAGFTNGNKGRSPAFVLPSNVLTFATEQRVPGHSAAYPVALPDWFIRLFTQSGDTVLDPFAGSFTTGVAAINTNRHFIGIEREPAYVSLGRARLATAEASRQPALFAAD
jgi:site-specific DNA-methyltransferase (adenine-specific)